MAIDMMGTDPVLVASPLVEIEVRGNLALYLDGERLKEARYRFMSELDGFTMVSQAGACRAGSATTVLTLDQRQAEAARSIGLSVIGR
ncbi:MAG: hypothetical protein MAG471_01212 [Acidimicrobiaceae bacterium]|nr:hypothetical protein [Acidimicrobiaceae bacterium]